MLIGELRIWFGILKSLNTNRYPEAKFYYVSSSNHSIPFILEAAVKQYIENKHFYYLLNIMKRSSPAFSRKKNTSTILDKNPLFCVYNLFVIICHWRLGLEGHVLLRKNIFGREKCTGGPYTCPALSYVLLKYRSRPITSISKK